MPSAERSSPVESSDEVEASIPESASLSRLLGKGSIYTAGAFIQLSAAGLAIPVVTRLLGPYDYGLVTLALVIQGVADAIVALGLPAAITRLYFGGSVSEGIERSRRLAASAMLVSLATVTVALLAMPLWGKSLEDPLTGIVVIGLILALPASIVGVTQAILRAQERARDFVIVSLLASAAAQMAGLAALLLVDDTPMAYLGGLLAGLSAAALVGYWLAGVPKARPAARIELGSALRLGLPTVPHVLSILGLALADRIVIELIDGTAAVGRYQVAYALGGVALMLLGAVQNAWSPITYSATTTARWTELASNATTILRLAALVAGALALTSPLGLLVLAPGSYDPGELVVVCGLIAASALPWGLYLAMVQVLFWEKDTRSLLWIGPLALTANIAAALLLVPPLGLPGAAVATIAAYAIQASLVYRASSALARVPWQWRSLGLSILLGAVLVGAGVAIPSGTAWGIVRAALAIVVLAVAATMVLEALRPGSLRRVVPASLYSIATWQRRGRA